MTYHHGGMGNEAETGTWRGPGPNPFTSGAAPVGTDMPIREVQLRLIRAGKSIVADGAWGAKTRGALESFARSRGITLPSFGTRGDYKLMGNKVWLPYALANALPEPASGAAARTRRQRSATPSVPSAAPPSEAVPPSEAAPPGTDSGADGGGGGGGAPWYESEMLKKAAPFAILALGGAAALFVWSRRRKPTALAAAPA
jgi:peptidoglycan hydrolase-like protein with peptidoglycan-binding domain